MPLPARIFPGDEELGKRDDDHRPGERSALPLAPSVWRSTFRFRRKRALPIVLFLLFVVLLYRRQQSEHGLSPALSNVTFTPWTPLSGPGISRPRPQASVPLEPPPVPETGAETLKHYYNGPIKLFQLATSLQAIGKGRSWGERNRHVLFAAASLKSAAVLIPIACEMARWRRSVVHFALMGRDDLPLQEILSINGVDESCKVTWHDARPDYSSYSTDLRLQVAIQGALFHINEFIHPQAVLVDASGQEEHHFVNSMQEKLNDLGTPAPLIGLPSDVAENMMWITRLDSQSLKAWNKASIDIVVHVDPKSSGAVIQLLKSLERVEFFLSNIPRLTIELPPVIDTATQQFLDNFKWPPKRRDEHQANEKLLLRHRIHRRGVSSEEASLRFVELFYPNDPKHAHLLVLSSQTKVSPLFYHFAKYHLLEYKYSSYSGPAASDMFGISLELPTSHLNGTAEFTPPIGEDDSDDTDAPVPQLMSFLWQAPNSNAALFFGDKWVEFHDFMSRRLEAQELRKLPPARKLVTKDQPSWMEFLLELFRVRGYYMLYPNFETGVSMATVHGELWRRPEEFADTPLKEGEDRDHHTTYLMASRKTEPVLASSPSSLISLLPFDGDLPEIEFMPILSYDGEQVTSVSRIVDAAEAYARVFATDVGGCESTSRASARDSRFLMKTDDLFCLDREDVEGEEETVQPAPAKAKENAVDPVPALKKAGTSFSSTSSSTSSTSTSSTSSSSATSTSTSTSLILPSPPEPASTYSSSFSSSSASYTDADPTFPQLYLPPPPTLSPILAPVAEENS
ncbi:MAG: hypothetical protein M1838_000768 [Thelocarpon superellum]|nr:MAG: hypothetical protein M1838_000768 [Thelocarpon superellum]